MTVEQLILELKKYPASMRVVVPGYERGFDDATPVTLRKAIIDANAKPEDESGKVAWYFGLHDEADDGDAGAVDVVLLGPSKN